MYYLSNSGVIYAVMAIVTLEGVGGNTPVILKANLFLQMLQSGSGLTLLFKSHYTRRTIQLDGEYIA